jgi:hypothetical protein
MLAKDRTGTTGAGVSHRERARLQGFAGVVACVSRLNARFAGGVQLTSMAFEGLQDYV